MAKNMSNIPAEAGNDEEHKATNALWITSSSDETRQNPQQVRAPRRNAVREMNLTSISFSNPRKNSTYRRYSPANHHAKNPPQTDNLPSAGPSTFPSIRRPGNLTPLSPPPLQVHLKANITSPTASLNALERQPKDFQTQETQRLGLPSSEVDESTDRWCG